MRRPASGSRGSTGTRACSGTSPLDGRVSIEADVPRRLLPQLQAGDGEDVMRSLRAGRVAPASCRAWSWRAALCLEARRRPVAPSAPQYPGLRVPGVTDAGAPAEAGSSVPRGAAAGR